MNSQKNNQPAENDKDLLGIASWERQRDDDELRSFIASKALDFSEIYDSL